jgi:hypothetical protein
MVDRFCLFRLHADTPRADAIARFRDVLDAEADALVVTIGTPADDTAKKWDVSVVIRCADLEALTALLARPAVRELLEVWLPPRTAIIKAWSFEVA